MQLGFLVSIIWLVFIAYWIASSFGVKKARINHNGAIGGWVPRIILIALIIILFSWQPLAQTILPENGALKTAGFILLILGLAFSVWARRTLGRNWSASLQIKQGHELVISGPYRYVRHPIYTGVISALLGTFLSFPQISLLILFALVTIGMVLRGRKEDGLMAQEFPESYPGYKQKVKFLIPFLY